MGTAKTIALIKAFGGGSGGNGGSGGGSPGGGSVLVVHEVEGTLDATYKQIVDAIHSNGAIFEEVGLTGYNVVAQFVEYGHDAESGAYVLVTCANHDGTIIHYFLADSENAYPVNDD